jgi:site-specific recombinase
VLDFGLGGGGSGGGNWGASDAGRQATSSGLPLQILEALLVVSHRIAALGLESELVRNHPQIERFDSPFLAQNAQMRQFTDEQRLARSENREPALDDQHLLVLLEQCEDIVAEVRMQAASSGASVNLTILLVRLAQHIDRLKLLLRLLEPRSAHELNMLRVRIFKQVVRAENTRNSLREQWRQTLDLLAARITQNASKRGEYYVTSTRSEYFQMLRSALGAGFIVAFMAMNKLELASETHSPLGGALLYSLNYALGFVLIYMLKFTIATKQPAMTASYLAACLANGDGDAQRRLDVMTELVVRTLRTQFVAIFGNVLLAFSVPVMLAYAIRLNMGTDFLGAEQARQLLSAQHPLESLAWLHAAIAGVCLFVAGLISGYFDNKAVYNRIPQRLLQLRGLRLLLGARLHQRLADYVENHLGALAGNFFFGCMLGSMGTLGYIIGLPLDIRHVTFSSAYVGYSAVALDWQLGLQTGVLIAVGVLGIGLINLLVSFSLALWVAMRAQRVPAGSARGLMLQVLRRFLRKPSEFFWPPKAAAAIAADTQAQAERKEEPT